MLGLGGLRIEHGCFGFTGERQAIVESLPLEQPTPKGQDSKFLRNIRRLRKHTCAAAPRAQCYSHRDLLALAGR